MQHECPSWLYPVTMGATTIWERWDSMLPDGSINPGKMTSFNHYAFGLWLIGYIAWSRVWRQPSRDIAASLSSRTPAEISRTHAQRFTLPMGWPSRAG